MFFKIMYFLLFVYLLSTALALYTNSRLIRDEFKGIPWKECFYPSKHFSFIVGNVFYYIVPLWILDQYVIRFYNENCRKCIESEVCTFNGKKGCGCNAYKKACSPLEQCSFDFYGPIIFNKKEAKEFLSSIKLTIKIESKNATNK